MVPLFCRQTDLLLSLPARTFDKTGLNMKYELVKGLSMVKVSMKYELT